MAYYSRSNLAYDFTLFEEDYRSRGRSARMSGQSKDESVDPDDIQLNNDEERTSGRRAEKNIKRVKRRKSNFLRIALGVVFGIAIAFVVVSIIHGQVQLTELNQEIADAKAMLAEQQSVYTQLEMKVDSSISTTVVEDYAKSKLNMSKAANSQKEYVNLSDGDKAEVSLSPDKNIFESIAEAISSLWS
ncbi:MAG: septum formation initiator family protein [Ruminococcus sp.]|nr:septum formation initiator family protein [Ruminococcus sp.]